MSLAKLIFMSLLPLYLNAFFNSIRSILQPKFDESRNAFDNWLQENKKLYFSYDDYEYRLTIFSENLNLINQRNKSNSSFKLGLNAFADLTDEEFETRFFMKFDDSEIEPETISPIKKPKNTNFEGLERSIDWVAKGAVNPVRDQMQCASCYAFSTISAIESAYFIKFGTLKSFSEQTVVDCGSEADPLIRGCTNAQLAPVMNFHKNVGVWESNKKPYYGFEQKCQYNDKPFTKIKDFVRGISTVRDFLENLEKGPVTFGLEMNFTIRWYHEGVIDILGPCGFNVGHNVVAIAYDLDANPPYIRIKNSWGLTWGKHGYMDIKILEENSRGMCNWIGPWTMRPYF